MHDPDVLAFSIPRPWPRRSGMRRRRWYWPSLVDVWHHEPGGADALTVCRDPRWRWHARHWRLRFPPLVMLRRRLLTRCAYCGGRSRRRDHVNVSAGSWDGPRGRWWRGERGLFHSDCLAADAAWRACVCRSPRLSIDRSYGFCTECGGFRAWGQTKERTAAYRAIRRAGKRGTRQREAVRVAYSADGRGQHGTADT